MVLIVPCTCHHCLFLGFRMDIQLFWSIKRRDQTIVGIWELYHLLSSLPFFLFIPLTHSNFFVIPLLIIVLFFSNKRRSYPIMTFDSQHITSSNNDNDNSLGKKVVFAGAFVCVFGVVSYYNSGTGSSTTVTTNLLQLKYDCYKNGKNSCVLGDWCHNNDDCPFVGPRNTSCCVFHPFSYSSCGTENKNTFCWST